MCFGPVPTCKFVDLYGVTEVSEDAWLFNKDATYGIIGMGPGSFFLEGFVDPDTKLATYSIELGRVKVIGEESEWGAYGVETSETHITFGSANDANYTGNPNVVVSANAQYTYTLTNFSYGIIYTDASGSDSS